MKEDFLQKKLRQRRDQDAFRQLTLTGAKADFCSNDYLGIARQGLIEIEEERFTYETVREYQRLARKGIRHGSTGSRLLAGNYPLIEEAETMIAGFHEAAAGLIFNSGFDANLGLLSAVPQKGDIILYDYLSHASIRDGIRLSFARAFSFAHNDLTDLERKLQTARAAVQTSEGSLFVVTESVFSMDGDQAPLQALSGLCDRYEAHLIVDEAHATGVTGGRGEGLVQELGLQEKCFARVYTFGKALGCHGAIVLGSPVLRDFLINFARSFIYTTALPPSAVLAIRHAYRLFPQLLTHRARLRELITMFRKEIPVSVPSGQSAPAPGRLESLTPIQALIVPGNEAVRAVARECQDLGLDIRPILYPTVPAGSERLRIVLHSFNTQDELERLTSVLRKKLYF